MALAAGDKIGPFEILALIGKGGMGEVYSAHDPRTGRDVAIKVSAERFSDRFDREVRAVAALNHPNICTLYDVGPNYLVMELIDGDSPQGPLPFETVLEYARQIAEALEAAHEKGIVHRDLKPGNIKITAAGKVKVLDFGLAKIGTPHRTDETFTIDEATQSGAILGTAAYMAPEQAQGKPVDKRADIWAFGVVLHELLTGSKVFRGDTLADTLAAVLTKDPEWESVPAKARLLLQRCLMRDPQRRLRDIGDAMALLESQPDPSQGTGTVPRSWLAWGAAGVFLLGLIGLGAIHFSERAPATSGVLRFHIPLPDKMGLLNTGAFSLSPDGQTLVFGAIGPDGVRGLWVQAQDSFLARPLPGSEISGNESPPFWSPDSRFVVFQTGGKLKKVSLQGDPPQTICDTPSPVIGGSWNPGGVILFGTETKGVMRVPAEGGIAISLTQLDSTRMERVHAFPVFLPDGNHFLYSRFSTVSENNGIYVGSLDAKAEEQGAKRLTASAIGAAFWPFPDGSGGKLLFQRGSTLLAQTLDTTRLELSGEAALVAEPVGSYRALGYFAVSGKDKLIYRSSPGPTVQMAWFDRQGKRVGSQDEPFVYEAGPSLSPDGERIASAAFDGSSVHIWIMEIARGTKTRVTSEQGLHSSPVWSPDAKRIAFSSTKRGHYDIYVKSADGSGSEELLFESSENKFPTSWSSDGNFLLFTSENAKTSFDLWALPLNATATTGSEKPKPFPIAQTEFGESQARFSRDSRWIAYVSNQSGKAEVYLQPFAPSFDGTSTGGGKTIVSKGGGTRPTWRSDGKELYYADLEGKALAVEIITNPTLKVGIPQPLFQMASNASGWDVGADGKRFLVAAQVSESMPAPFTVVLNWQAALKK
jgi:Tol biopolymer transport system component/predicted Ser/Thr protein kinase